MKALVYRGKGKLILESVPKPKIDPDEVLIKVRSVGICGTDLHILNGGTDVKPGTIIGHEFSGDVVAVGPQVKHVKRGDRAVGGHQVCGTCYFCLRGKPNLCLNAKMIGMERHGALADFIALKGTLTTPFPRSVSYDEAALSGTLATTIHAAAQAGFLLEKKVAVVGQGPIGVLLDQVLKTCGADVVGIDVLSHRLEFVKKKGWADTVLNAASPTFKRQLAAFAPLGVDVAFEAVGKDVTAQTCIDITRRDGLIYLIGVHEKPATLKVMDIVKKELTVTGSWTYIFARPVALDLMAQKKIDVKSIITHIADFRDAPRVFAEASQYSDKRMKTIIRIA